MNPDELIALAQVIARLQLRVVVLERENDALRRQADEQDGTP